MDKQHLFSNLIHSLIHSPPLADIQLFMHSFECNVLYNPVLISDFVINANTSFASTFVRLKEVFLTLYWNHI